MQEMKLTEFKNKKPPELIAYAESLEVENASVMRKQELMFAILKKLAAQDVEIIGDGVVEVLQDGFGSVSYTHLRAHETVLDLVCRLLLENKKTAVASATRALTTLLPDSNHS